MRRGCYGCFGPMESANAPSLASQFRILGASRDEVDRAFRSYNGWSWPFRRVFEEAPKS